MGELLSLRAAELNARCSRSSTVSQQMPLASVIRREVDISGSPLPHRTMENHDMTNVVTIFLTVNNNLQLFLNHKIKNHADIFKSAQK